MDEVKLFNLEKRVEILEKTIVNLSDLMKEHISFDADQHVAILELIKGMGEES